MRDTARVGLRWIANPAVDGVPRGHALAGALLLAAPRAGAVTGARLAMTGAGLALVSAVSLYVQLGFSDPLLGGSATSAAYFLCLTVVAVVATRPMPVVLTARHAPMPAPAR